jgi:hypothetical protein
LQTSVDTLASRVATLEELLNEPAKKKDK